MIWTGQLLPGNMRLEGSCSGGSGGNGGGGEGRWMLDVGGKGTGSRGSRVMRGI